MIDIIEAIAKKLEIKKDQVKNTVDLLQEGSTVPFISRYRKEVTGGLEDVRIREIEENLAYYNSLEERKEVILRSIEEQGKLTDELRAKIENSESKTEIEDLYLPYKPKRQTKAQKAKDAGIEPLADAIMEDPSIDLKVEAAKYVNEEKGYGTPDEVLEGAKFIIIDKFAEDAEVLSEMRSMLWNGGHVVSKKVAEDDSPETMKFQDYFDFYEKINKIPSHRALAMLRGKNEGVLSVSLSYDLEVEDEKSSNSDSSSDRQGRQGGSSRGGQRGFGNNQMAMAFQSLSEEINGKSAPKETKTEAKKTLATKTSGQEAYENVIKRRFGLKSSGSEGDMLLDFCARMAFKGKIFPSLETELLNLMRENAEKEAVNVFSKNLKDILLAAPAGGKVTLGLDPGIRTGVKVALVDATGRFVKNTTIYPFQPKNDVEGAKRALKSLILDNKVELIAIGNGTASRETDKLVIELMKELAKEHGPNGDGTFDPESLKKIVVSEAGASVYSASDIAREEFPDLDVTVRGAISIARRLQDPLAELIKIDPKSIGVGQYQHDVNQNDLMESLGHVVEDCVNKVGVNLNTASWKLLSYISGLNNTIAKNIVEYRDANGAFKNRKELLKVPKLGPKTFEQAAGFLRINGGQEPLDSSSVHPEAYNLVYSMLDDLGVKPNEIIGNDSLIKKIERRKYITEKFGLPTINDILDELHKPGRDPRGKFVSPEFNADINDITDLVEGMILDGSITNVTNFGAFVDIGVHKDGLVHKSQMGKVFGKRYINDPKDFVKVGDIVKVKVGEIDIKRGKISLELVKMLTGV